VTQVAPIVTPSAAPPAPPSDFHLDTNGATAPPPPKMITVKLLRNYRPRELPDPANKGKFLPPVFEIVGHTSPAILKKNAAGVLETVQDEQFIDGEQPPPPSPGTGFETKIWAGTVLKVVADEAKAMRKAGIAEYEILD
jgi:hypothetical protein